jgi:hypothetical protein
MRIAAPDPGNVDPAMLARKDGENEFPDSELYFRV